MNNGKLVFQINVPHSLALRAIEGEPVPSQFGGDQHKFISDKGVFYVSDTVGRILTEQFRKLEVKPGDRVEICKAEVDAGRGRKQIQWLVALPVDPESTGEQANGTFVVPKRTPSTDTGMSNAGVSPKPPAKAAVNGAQKPASAPPQLPWAQHLLNQTVALLDVYSAALRYANEQHAGVAIRPDDVRALMTTAYINASKGANYNAA